MRLFSAFSVSLVLVASQVLAEPIANMQYKREAHFLQARQGGKPLPSPDQCKSQCQPLIDVFANPNCGTNATCLCSQTVDDAFKVCGNCAYKYSSSDEKKQLQSAVDEYVSNCNGAGFSISPIKLTSGTVNVLGGAALGISFAAAAAGAFLTL